MIHPRFVEVIHTEYLSDLVRIIQESMPAYNNEETAVLRADLTYFYHQTFTTLINWEVNRPKIRSDARFILTVPPIDLHDETSSLHNSTAQV